MKYKDIEKCAVSVLDHIQFWLQRIWYLLIVVLLSIYVLCNFEDCISMTFFSDFDGRNILFILWLIILFLPLVDKIEILGVNMKMKNDSDAISKVYEDRFKQQEQLEQSNKGKETKNE